MTGDDRLRAELEALERSAPASIARSDIGLRPARWLRIGLIGATVTAGLVATLAVTSQQPRQLGGASQTPNPPVVAEARDGDVILTLSSPRSQWTTDSPVEIRATLTYVGDRDRVNIGGAGVGFGLIQVSGGDAMLRPAIAMICRRDLYSLQPNKPVDVPFLKPGRTSPNSEFFRDGELHLAAGRWEVVAWAALGLEECGGLDLEAAVEIEVVATDASPAQTENVPPDSPDAQPSAEVKTGDRITAAGMSFVLPPGWTYREPTFVSHGPGWPVIYFSNQPMHDECVRIGNSETCDRPIDELAADGVLIDWWASGDYPYPTPRPLPSGAPYEMGGWDAVRNETDAERCGLQATDAERIVFRRSDMARDELMICSRGLTPATRAELEDLLASIEFVVTRSE